MLVKAIGIIFLLGVCITIHELGHLLMGKLSGAKAKIFSLGYGRGIWKKEINGTTWQITALPIGGYVQFYGADYHEPLTHNGGELMALPPLRRMIPIIGGPLFNLILGFIIYFCLTFTGIESLTNEIVVGKESTYPAYDAGLRTGDKIVAVNGEATPDFNKIRAAIMLSDPAEPLKLDVLKSPKNKTKNEGDKKIERIAVHPHLPSQGKPAVLGILPAYDSIRLAVAHGPQPRAANQKLKAGNEIIKINGKPITTQKMWQAELEKYRGKSVSLTATQAVQTFFSPWQKQEIEVQVPVTAINTIKFSNIKDSRLPRQKVAPLVLTEGDAQWVRLIVDFKVNGKKMTSAKDFYALGVKNPVTVEYGKLKFKAKMTLKKKAHLIAKLDEMIVPKRIVQSDITLGDRFVYVGNKIVEIVSVSLQGIGKLFSGQMSASDNLAGPIQIAQIAGMTLESGFVSFFDFMGYISIVLMFMNLLPFPVVDGGYLVLFAIEAIRGRPLPVAVMDALLRVGFMVLLFLGIFVIINDTMKLF